jgi:putative transposase
LIADYRSRGLNVSRILSLLDIPRSTHYHSPPSLQIRGGRKASLMTERITDSGIIAITDEQLLLDIRDLLGREFVCYGYRKVTKYLQRSGYVINRKKVFRIMKENNLLNHTYNHRSPARRVVDPIVTVNAPNEIWEMDIKYIYIQGENRTTYFFAMIDCFTREVVGRHIGYHCTSDDVNKAMDFAFLDRGIERISHVRIRSDNGSQFVSRTVKLFLSSSNITHERIHPATPKEDAHIESFNSILEKEVIRRFEFSSFEDADNTISRFIEFYNNERLHSAINYRTPREVYEKWKENIIEGSA